MPIKFADAFRESNSVMGNTYKLVQAFDDFVIAKAFEFLTEPALCFNADNGKRSSGFSSSRMLP